MEKELITGFASPKSLAGSQHWLPQSTASTSIQYQHCKSKLLFHNGLLRNERSAKVI